MATVEDRQFRIEPFPGGSDGNLRLVEVGNEREFHVVGTRPIRHDGTDKVTGRARYGADIKLSGLLHGAVLRSPHAHARILSIDTSKAEALSGVHAVVTNADLADATPGVTDLGEGGADRYHLNQNILAKNKVLYTGHPVAAVAADTVHLAEEAAALIEVEYEVLTPVMDVREARLPDAPVLNEDVRTELQPAGETSEPDKPTNVAKHFVYEIGDVDTAFAEAALVVEREFTTATVHQGYIEPHTATAVWSADGKITIWTSTQGSFLARSQVSDLVGVPVSRIKVVPMEIGGGFGGKVAVYLPPVAAILAKKSGRAVKLTMDRSSVFESTGPTPGSYMKVKVGVDADGMITAGDAELLFEAGGFPGSPIAPGCWCVFTCYDVPNGRVNGYDICVNKPRSNAYRAPGSTQVAFAMETIVDEICEKLGMCPIAFRKQNAAKEGTRRIDGPTHPRIGMWETMHAAELSDHWQTPLEGPHRGRGIASGFWFNAGLNSAVTATVNEDGMVSLIEGSTDIGGSRAAIAMQLAEVLGIAAEDVIPTVVDTESIGYTDVTGGSRTTHATGLAAIKAAEDIRDQLCERAALLWDVDAATVVYGENATITGPDDQSISFKDLAGKLLETGGPVLGRGAVNADKPGGAYGTHIADVEVDPDTGKVQVLRYTVIQDVGTAIHPAYVEGQLQGGAVQGIGWALNEEYFYDDEGRMHNASFLDYRIPTSCDVPMIETIIVEVPNPGHDFGVRGVGEVPIVPPPGALANAIFHATGVRMRSLPMSPPKLLPEILAGQ
jgi:CO/xanthine dehydrogenase Mo-binding subunit